MSKKNIKLNENEIISNEIYKMINDNKIECILSKQIIKKSEVFITSENNLVSNWENSRYWRQQRVFQDLIIEIKNALNK